MQVGPFAEMRNALELVLPICQAGSLPVDSTAVEQALRLRWDQQPASISRSQQCCIIFEEPEEVLRTEMAAH